MREAQASNPFKRIKSMGENKRVVGKWSGVLPACEGTRYYHSIIHTLLCIHLRDIPGERYSPYKARPYLTHEIFIFYRVETDDVVHLIFRSAFDFSRIKTAASSEDLKNSDLPFHLIEPDRIAIQCCRALVNVMTTIDNPRLLIRYDTGWAQIVEATHDRIEAKALTFQKCF